MAFLLVFQSCEKKRGVGSKKGNNNFKKSNIKKVSKVIIPLEISWDFCSFFRVRAPIMCNKCSKVSVPVHSLRKGKKSKRKRFKKTLRGTFENICVRIQRRCGYSHSTGTSRSLTHILRVPLALTHTFYG
jgi:hypothetical protein